MTVISSRYWGVGVGVNLLGLKSVEAGYGLGGGGSHTFPQFSSITFKAILFMFCLYKGLARHARQVFSVKSISGLFWTY